MGHFKGKAEQRRENDATGLHLHNWREALILRRKPRQTVIGYLKSDAHTHVVWRLARPSDDAGDHGTVAEHTCYCCFVSSSASNFWKSAR